MKRRTVCSGWHLHCHSISENEKLFAGGSAFRNAMRCRSEHTLEQVVGRTSAAFGWQLAETSSVGFSCSGFKCLKTLSGTLEAAQAAFLVKRFYSFVTLYNVERLNGVERWPILCPFTHTPNGLKADHDVLIMLEVAGALANRSLSSKRTFSTADCRLRGFK